MKKIVTNWVAGLREHFYLSQQQLADYLSVTRSLVALAERNRRNLPAHALEKLNRLEAIRYGGFSKAAEKKVAALAKIQTASTLKTLHKKMVTCHILAERYRKQLLLAETNYQRAMNCLQMVSSLPATPATNKDAKKDAKWMELMELEAMSIIKMYGAETQTLLRLKLSSLENEAVQATTTTKQIKDEGNVNV